MGAPRERWPEIERLLDAAAQTGDFLAKAASVHLASLVSQMPNMESAEPGARLGAYELVRQLGRGGMATVYLARDLKHDREVALKVLRPELAAALGAQRFLQEIRITASVDHPHILTLIDSGSDGGTPWYAADVYRAVGDTANARLYYQRVIETWVRPDALLVPERDDAARRLAELERMDRRDR